MLFLLIFALFLPERCYSQNIATSKHLLIRPQFNGSAVKHFGASLAVRSTQEASFLFIGAPSGGISDANANAGEVYHCLVPGNTYGVQTCGRNLTFDKTGALGISLSVRENKLVVCGNRYMYTCPKDNIEQRMNGVCHSYVIATDTSEELTSPCPHQCPKNVSALDIFFVVDESTSITVADFEVAKGWIKDVVRGFEGLVNNGSVWVGMVTFGTSSLLRFNLVQRTFAQFTAEVDKVFRTKGITRTDAGILLAASQFALKTRPTVPSLMIVVTDGDSDFPANTKTEAQAARDKGITMMAVGIGRVKVQELRDIAGNEQRVLYVDGFDQLSSILSNLRQVIQETVVSGLEGTTTNLTNELYQCQVGISGYHAKGGNFHTGAVGSFDRVGSVIEYAPSSVEYGDSLTFAELGIVTQTENVTSLRDSYLGYSVSSGNFLGSDAELIASGMPRYMTRGQVLFYPPLLPITSATNNHYSLHPLGSLWQIGAYFGQSLLAIDLNKDSYDDLLVSAPLYSDVTGFDQGRVFVYMNDPSRPGPRNWLTSSPILLSGSNALGARFGYSLGSVGDVDQNGYNDVIIGAPLEEATPTSSGAVYIYYLSASGITESRKQRILGKSLNVPLIQFGAAVLTGRLNGSHVNFDDKYPDVITAAPSSDTVVVLRSRPIIEVTSSVTLHASDVNVMACSAKYNESCSTVKACLNASLRNSLEQANFDFNVSIDLDSLIGQANLKRFIIFGSQVSTQRNPNEMVGKVQTCIEYDVQLNKFSLRDHSTQALWFQTALRAKFSFDLTNQHKDTDFSGVLDPVVDHFSSADWSIQTGCAGGKCEHDLSATASFSISSSVEPLVLTKNTGTLSVSVIVRNLGPSPSYFTKVNITSGSLSRSNVVGNCVSLIDDVSTSGQTVLTLVMSSPVLTDLIEVGDACQFLVEYDLRSLTTNATVDNITINGLVYSNLVGNTTSIDSNPSNNRFHFTRQVRYSAALLLGGSSSENQIAFNRSLTPDFATDVNDQVLGGLSTNIRHTHFINGLGPLVVKTAVMTLTWPKSLGVHPLFYLYDFQCQPIENCLCNVKDKVNPLGLAINNQTAGNQVNLIFPEPSAIVLKSQLTCEDVTCGTMTCSLKDMTSSTKVTLVASFKVWLPTLAPESVKTEMFSELLVNASGLPLHPDAQIYKNKVTTVVRSTIPEREVYKPPETNVGAIIGGVLGGVAILAIVILVMWKTGFFKSKYGEMTREARQTEDNVQPSTAEHPYEIAN